MVACVQIELAERQGNTVTMVTVGTTATTTTKVVDLRIYAGKLTSASLRDRAMLTKLIKQGSREKATWLPSTKTKTRLY